MLHETLVTNARVCAHQHNDSDVLFRIAPVTIHANGKAFETFAFLDSGSSLTLLDKEVAETLKLKGVNKPLCLKWTADVVREEMGSLLVSIEVSSQQGSLGNSKRYMLQGVRTVEKLSLPKQSFDASAAQAKYRHLRGLPLHSYTDVQPKLLIGLQNEYLGAALKISEGMCNEPIAMKTRLGWIVCGSYGRETKKQHHSFHHYQACECERELHEDVHAYFALESHGTGKEYVETDDEKRALSILKQTTRRIGNSFESGLLWKNDDIQMPNSYPMALKRLQCIERKMQSDPSLKDSLNRQMASLLQKGYARQLNQMEAQLMTPRTWYLPTFVVTNPNKPGKIRLVWDGAARVGRVSLNSMLLKGPDQLVALPKVLYSFRARRVAINGDISEMFHQIRVRKEDQQAQRFLWRNGESERAPDAFVMEVVTFGASCSPSVAHHHRVDTDQEAIQLAKDIQYIHSRGGFHMRGWLSNSSAVVKALGESSGGDKQIQGLSSAESTSAKVLGIWWKTEADIFTFSIRLAKVHEDILEARRAPTKRELLKVLMSIFDPLCFLAHYLVMLKVLLQEVWRSGIDWDETIPERLQHQWNEWLRILPLVENVRIPRCYSKLTADDNVSIQLHVFVDASEHAMAAVAYFRICLNDSVECAFVGAKTKVGPRIPISIPRMELQAAAMGVRLAQSILKGHPLRIQSKVFWSDSRTVLSWLSSDPRRYNPFVMFRIGEVLENSKLAEWKWIPSRDNVADDATKWKRMPIFDCSDRWYKGPSFLFESEDKWPGALPETNEEEKDELRPRFLLQHELMKELLIDTERFSSWKRLVRTVAWVLRFVENLKQSLKRRELCKRTLSQEELKQSQTVVVRMAQHDAYGNEIAILVNGGKLCKSNVLYKCSPYIDDDGLLRMKGRIDNADCVEFSTKRPLLMPGRNQVTALLIHHYHEIYHHCCHESVVNEIRQRFWIPRLRTVLKMIRRKCMRCKLNRAKPMYPEMAQLPAARLSAFTRPFTHVGVDYFGPIIVTVGRRAEKRWGVLFTCLTIRAIHLELAHSLSTDSCILCVRNFIGRRGNPKAFFSDNGTNFKGAERELQEAFKELDAVAIENRFTSTETKWVFNPPSAPHMGGSWERLVGSVKKILQEVTRNQRLTDESLQSMFIEIEAITNSRPLTHVSLDAVDAEALTPNHFLLGSSDGSKPIGEFGDKDLLLRRNWRKCQQLTNIFWKRWVREYLPTLTQRPKWFDQAKPIKVGDVVIIIDENLPRGCWPKGIVQDVTRSADGQVRRASVKTVTGVYVRPAVKLAVLAVSGSREGETTTRDSSLTEGECH